MSSTKIYWENPLVSTFKVKVITCSQSDEHYELVIDKESIRPEGGGQAGDRGTITFNEDKGSFSNALHRDGHVTLLSNIEVQEGTEIELELDMDWRRGMMRNHTAEHLFVGSLLRINSEAELGYIWIDGNRGTIEIKGDSVTFEQIIQTEKKVQEIIDYEIPVESRLVDSLELDVKVRAREGVSKHESFRIISVQGFDHSACSGTHVLNTQDIGTFKVIDYKLTEEGARLEFATSSKAIEALSQIYNMVLERKHDYPFEMIQLGHILDKSKKSLEDHRKLLDEVASILNQGTVSEIIKGVSFRSHYLPGFSAQELRETIKKIDHAEESVTLLFAPGTKCNFVIWTNGLDTNPATTISNLIDKLKGKGGGSGNSYTGGFSNVVSPRELYESFVDELKNWLTD